ncbi:hypothetical protein KFE98_16005 [bacterium SCSIO 12741]|nr:hypothetical protein KFE98_16005 [bacterium SCSIO 12741]
MEINDINSALVIWNEMRGNAGNSLLMLASGHYFEIPRSMYTFWENKGVGDQDTIHAYVGVVEVPDQRLKFLMIDSIADAQHDPPASEVKVALYQYGDDENVPIPVFRNNPPHNQIDVLEGLERSFRWMINRKEYVIQEAAKHGEDSGIFQAMHIPMKDLTELFGDPSCASVMAVIGMREDYVPELILWNNDFSKNELVEDVALPIPPFRNNQSDYQLLHSALH